MPVALAPDRLSGAAAGERHVTTAGGAATVQQYLAAGLLDEVYLHIVPVLLGAGERLPRQGLVTGRLWK